MRAGRGAHLTSGRCAQDVVRSYSDGINFDYEVPMRRGSRVARQYAVLVAETASRLHQLGSYYQVVCPRCPSYTYCRQHPTCAYCRQHPTCAYCRLHTPVMWSYVYRCHMTTCTAVM